MPRSRDQMMDELKRYRRKSSLRLWKAYLKGKLDEEFRRINRESMRMYREELRAIDRADRAARRKTSARACKAERTTGRSRSAAPKRSPR